jgi:hypothetical protein
LHFSYLRNTLFRLEKQAARRGAINTSASLTRATRELNPMTQAKCVLSTPPTNTSAIDDPQPSPISERFERNPQTFVGCMGSTLVYVGVADRKTFDEIGAPCQDAGENEYGHVLVKQIGNHGKDEVTVIFQYWIKSRTIDALIADRQAESGRAQS